MINFKQIWQRMAARLKRPVSPPEPPDVKRDVAAIRGDNTALHVELDNVRHQLEQSRDENSGQLAELQQRLVQAEGESNRKLDELQQRLVQATDESSHKLAELQQRVELAESERTRVQQHLQVLRTELNDTTARQGMAETRAREMETELKRENNKLLDLMQQLGERENKIEKRAALTLWIVSAALLLGVVSSAAVVWSMRNSDRMLAELVRDIRDIRQSVAQLPARTPAPPVAGSYEAPPAVAALPPPVSSMDTPEPKPRVISMQRSLLPNPVAVNPELADSLNRTFDSRWDTKAFFIDNAKQWGVATLPNGTQYRVISKGNGKRPVVSDRVVVNYRGFRLDGTEFDSAYADEDAESATFTVDEVIPGWKEALLSMEEGAQWELYIPPELAQASGTRNRSLLGFEPLVYVIELKSVLDDSETAEDR
jgi:hypothetical protein